MSQLPIQLIIWDLDGTLVDSLPATFAAFNAGLKPFLGKELSDREIMSHFGPPDQEIIRKLVGETNYEESYSLVLAHMKRNIHMIQYFEGIMTTLDQLKNLGFQNAIFTGRGRVSTDLILENLKAVPHFIEIITNDEVSNHKPHPEGIHKILTKASLKPQKAVMLGDSIADVKSGREAGTKTIGCTWSPLAAHFHGGDKRPDFVIKKPEELVPLMKRLCGI